MQIEKASCFITRLQTQDHLTIILPNYMNPEKSFMPFPQ